MSSAKRRRRVAIESGNSKRIRKQKLYIPIAFRLGKVFVKEKHTWNFYGEYRTSLVYKGWAGSAVKNSYRINATYSIPVG